MTSGLSITKKTGDSTKNKKTPKMAKPRYDGVRGDKIQGASTTNSVARISKNPPVNSKLLEADQREICEKLLPLVSGWERNFLHQIIGQSKLSAPQKRKLGNIANRHFWDIAQPDKEQLSLDLNSE